ncbi:tyrosine/DOPA decarboxylase 1-like [Punica granatum]|uniref:Tyrosine/DOPA decarboxylase 1-like n=1 Tax=Punica granatum TaxID=22663 RepID=A0A218WCG4_PUNGR|nr:tyrosine/DOPA decarboxylase 1-like [Punica granatum]OWM70495.1 hypothetical protein CDL15_Pgr011971 [Punica granatum]
MGSLKSEEALESNCTNPLDPDEFRRQGHMIIDFLADYYKTIEDHPVCSQVEPGHLSDALPSSPPYMPEPLETIVDDIRKHIVPGLTHWQSPNFFGYYQSNASTAGILGEILCSGFGVVGFSWVSSPAATELESLVMEWLGEMLKLPRPFLFSGGGGGVIHGNTCEAIICTLAAARDKVLREIGEENITKLVVYCSDQTHCSFKKAAQVVGINAQNIRAINTTKVTEFGMCPSSLKQAIARDIKEGLVPLYLCATIGTTATSAVDPVKELCRVAEEHNVWVHVDAAYAGAACICPEYRGLIDGVELANSFSFNAHKWLLTGLDCCCLWVKDSAALRQALSSQAECLRNKPAESKKVIDYKDWQISLSRRFRALKLWLVLRSHGVANLRKYILSHVRLAKLFEELVGEDDRFEVVCKRNFALVCFRISPSALGKQVLSTGYLSGDASIDNDNIKDGHTVEEPVTTTANINDVNKRLLEEINGTGRVFMTHAVVGGVYAIRFAVGATLVQERHVRFAWKLVQGHADAILRDRP